MAQQQDEPFLNYSIKELIETVRREQSEGFGRLYALLDAKEDKATVAALRAQFERDITHLHGRIDTLDGDMAAMKGGRDTEEAVRADQRQAADTRAARRNQLVASWTAIIIAVAAVVAILIQTFK